MFQAKTSTRRAQFGTKTNVPKIKVLILCISVQASATGSFQQIVETIFKLKRWKKGYRKKKKSHSILGKLKKFQQMKMQKRLRTARMNSGGTAPSTNFHPNSNSQSLLRWYLTSPSPTETASTSRRGSWSRHLLLWSRRCRQQSKVR